MSDLDPLTKKKAKLAKINGAKSITKDDSIYVVKAAPMPPGTYTSILHVHPGVFRDGGDTTQHTNLPRKPKLKKGCGQRKNRRDKAGRALHVQLLPYGHQPTVTLAG